MNILSRTLATLLLVSAVINAKEPPAPASADLLLREIRYNATLADAEARFVADIDLESLNRAEGSLPLFEGEGAGLRTKLPPGLRIVRAGSQHRVAARTRRRHRFGHRSGRRHERGPATAQRHRPADRTKGRHHTRARVSRRRP